MGWGGSGMLTFICIGKPCCCYVGRGVGRVWDVDIHLRLQTMLMLRGAWGGTRSGGVGWDVNVHLRLQIMLTLRCCWGGMGWAEESGHLE